MNLCYICGLVLLGVAAVPFAAGNGTSNTTGIVCQEENSYPTPVCYKLNCMNAIKNHIQHEFHAAFKYLYMGAVFGQHIVERPGMANFFLESASEERSHAIQMLDYLQLRGFKYNRNYKFSKDKLWKWGPSQIDVEGLKDLSIKSALQEAVNMEVDVTKKILGVIEQCEDDYHSADVFTNPILEEQYTGMRKLQGAIKTMNNLLRGHQDPHGIQFAEYVFDQKLVKGEVL